MMKVRMLVCIVGCLAVILGSALTAAAYDVKWQVVATGGTNANFSDGKKILGTVVQTAIGSVVSPNFRVNQGFWQEFTVCRSGDADGSGTANISDAVYIINFIFLGGPEPTTGCGGDADGNGITNISDAVWLIKYIFQSP